MLLILFWISGVHNFPFAPPLDITPPIVSVQPRHVHLALGEEKDTFSVSWSTVNKTRRSTVIVYNDQNDRSETLFEGLSVLFVDGGIQKSKQWIHKVVVSGLNENTSFPPPLK